MKFGGLRLYRDDLAEDIINFCMTNNLFSVPELECVSVESLAKELEYKQSVEQVIQTLIARAGNMNRVDLRKLQELLIELNELRLNLESSE